jgi:hypothetical protein
MSTDNKYEDVPVAALRMTTTTEATYGLEIVDPDYTPCRIWLGLGEQTLRIEVVEYDEDEPGDEAFLHADRHILDARNQIVAVGQLMEDTTSGGDYRVVVRRDLLPAARQEAKASAKS